MKNLVWLLVGFGLAYYLILQKYGSLTTALASWSPSVQSVISMSQPALASGGQGSGSLAPESSFYATTLPNSYNPTPPASGNNAAATGAQHVYPVNVTRPSIPVGGPVRAVAPGGQVLKVMPVAQGRQFVTTSHSGKAATTYKHNVIGPIGTA